MVIRSSGGLDRADDSSLSGPEMLSTLTGDGERRSPLRRTNRMPFAVWPHIVVEL
jgi:hypothetical protein